MVSMTTKTPCLIPDTVAGRRYTVCIAVLMDHTSPSFYYSTKKIINTFHSSADNLSGNDDSDFAVGLYIFVTFNVTDAELYRHAAL